jgi:hypothetical protein
MRTHLVLAALCAVVASLPLSQFYGYGYGYGYNTPNYDPYAGYGLSQFGNNFGNNYFGNNFGAPVPQAPVSNFMWLCLEGQKLLVFLFCFVCLIIIAWRTHLIFPRQQTSSLQV